MSCPNDFQVWAIGLCCLAAGVLLTLAIRHIGAMSGAKQLHIIGGTDAEKNA